MRLKPVLLILLVTFFAAGIFYLLNDELFCKEYWTQKKINDYQTEQPIILTSNPNSLIRYKFYHDNGIDFAIELNNLGYLSVKTNAWFDESIILKSLVFNVDKDKFNVLHKQLVITWPSSIFQDIDNHLGGIYYEIEFIDLKREKNNLKIGYYNVVPNKSFLDFKNELINLAESKLDKAD